MKQIESKKDISKNQLDNGRTYDKVIKGRLTINYRRNEHGR